MSCEYCGEADCNMAGLPVEQMVLVARKCRDRAHDRALRAEAELAAHLGDETALDPYLPDGWRSYFLTHVQDAEWRRSAGKFHADVDRRGNWRVMQNEVWRVASNTPDGGILAAIHEADLALNAAILAANAAEGDR
jgi:hypothetical protein